MPGPNENRKSRNETAHDPVALALAEDIGSGDLTCEFFVDAARRGKARIFAKQPCILAGTEAAARAFALVGASLEVRTVRKDGDALQSGDTAIEIAGPVRASGSYGPSVRS